MSRTSVSASLTSSVSVDITSAQENHFWESEALANTARAANRQSAGLQ